MTRNYLGTFLSRCDVYVHIDVTMATDFWQPCFSKFAFFLKLGCNSIVINGVTILLLSLLMKSKLFIDYFEKKYELV